MLVAAADELGDVHDGEVVEPELAIAHGDADQAGEHRLGHRGPEEPVGRPQAVVVPLQDDGRASHHQQRRAVGDLDELVKPHQAPGSRDLDIEVRQRRRTSGLQWAGIRRRDRGVILS